ILLGSTEWGISCEKLLGTETLTPAQIKWRKASGKRPWLAGMVKDKMCALIHAEELIKLLNSGMNIYGH
ncbi:MAG: chemotaxis protein CheW, partial [Psychromonas sp.]|nr:chemotaxis protein CheW [Psychromonas sp.]